MFMWLKYKSTLVSINKTRLVHPCRDMSKYSSRCQRGLVLP